jgi:F-type H+-transporting ATPase subunit b
MDGLIRLDVELVTVLIQVAATLVLFLVVTKFAVKPMKKFLAAREALIAGQFAEAEKTNADAQVALDEAGKEIKAAKFEAEKIIEAAKEDATAKGEAIIEQGRVDAEQEMKKASEEIKRERQNMLDTTKKEIAAVTTVATEKLIRKEINADVHQNLFEEFVGLVGGSNE